MIARVLSIVVSLLVALTVAECGVRAWEARVGARNLASRLNQQPKNLPQLNSVLQLVQKNQRGINAGVLYETNSFGIRGPERALAKPDGVARTVVIGDSFAMGSGVLYEDTFSAQLERSMPELDGRRHEVINLGISGFNLRDSLTRYLLLGAPFHADLLVYAYTLNDLEDKRYLRMMECSARREGHRDFWLHLWRHVGEAWLWIDEALRKPPGSYPHELTYNYFHNDLAWQDFDQQLARLRDIARRDGACAIVLIQTQLQALNPWHPFSPFYDRVADASRAKGLFVIETFPYFRHESASSMWVSRADVHPNARGHAILSRALADGIAQLPPRCFERNVRDNQ